MGPYLRAAPALQVQAASHIEAHSALACWEELAVWNRNLPRAEVSLSCCIPHAHTRAHTHAHTHTHSADGPYRTVRWQRLVEALSPSLRYGHRAAYASMEEALRDADVVCVVTSASGMPARP